MLKLSDPDYFLPDVYPLEAGPVLSSGRTKPMIVRGVCEQTGIKGEYVVKLIGSQHMWTGACLNEILASLIAREFHFNAPAPVLFHITPAFVETMRGRHENFDAAFKSIGINFATEYITGYQVIVPGQSLPQALYQQLFELFALDMFLGNVDRRHDKPNFSSNGKDLLIFDHELAFDFTLALFRNPEPWTIRAMDMANVENNFCYRLLKGKNFDFSDFAVR